MFVKKSKKAQFNKQLPLQCFIWAGMIWLLFFSFMPLTGLITAFKDFDVRDGFIGMFTGEFVGFKYFKEFLTDRKFGRLMQNTLIISGLKLVLSTPLAILLAIMFDEMPGKKYKRLAQTVSYLPHFISWVIVAGIFFSFFSESSGLINEVLIKTGLRRNPINILTNPDQYYLLTTTSELWKETGWNAIIFMAAISGIDDTLYESAQIDGAGRLKRIWHVTLPGMKPTIAIILILSVGSLLGGANFDQAMMFSNSMNISNSEIMDVYVYKTGLGLGRYSYAAAVGLFQSMISLFLVLTANRVSHRVADTSLF